MQTTQNTSLEDHIPYEYTSFDRVVLRENIQYLFIEGSVISLLRNLGFTKHSNGVMRILTNKLNSHIKKTSVKRDVLLHWWGEQEKKKYHSKIDYTQDQYKTGIATKN